jgi:hypothetical protein
MDRSDLFYLQIIGAYQSTDQQDAKNASLEDEPLLAEEPSRDAVIRRLHTVPSYSAT